MKKLFAPFLALVVLAFVISFAPSTTVIANAPPQIYMFSGPANPNTDTNFQSVNNAGILTGVVQEIYWGQLDTSTACPGSCTYNFSALDSTLLANYTTGTYAGFPIDLILAPALDVSICTNGTCANTTTNTPSYIYDGVTQLNATCATYTGGLASGYTVSATQTVGWPVMFQSGAANAYMQMVSHLIAHINANLSSSYNITLLVPGGAHGGENNPQCSADVQTALGISQSQLVTNVNSYMATLASTIAAASPNFKVAITLACLGNNGPPNSGGNNCSMADSMAASAYANGVGLRITNAQALDYIELAGNAPTAGDWIAMFDKYKGAAVLDVQQSAESDPTAVYPTSPGRNCNSGTGSTAGSLTQLGPFISQHWTPTAGARIWEVYSQDLKAVYGTLTDTCWPSGAGGSGGTYTAAYNSTYRGILQGNPAGTTVSNGRTFDKGSTSKQ